MRRAAALGLLLILAVAVPACADDDAAPLSTTGVDAAAPAPTTIAPTTTAAAPTTTAGATTSIPVVPTTTSPATTTSTTSTSTTTTTTVPPPDPATVVFFGGPVLTIDGGRVAEAIAISGETIVAVGEEAEILRYVGTGTTVIDLEGAVLMPGIVDAHGHWISDHHLAGIGDPGDAALAAAASGVTTMYDTFIKADDLADLLALDRAGRLPIRVTAYFPVNFLTRFYGIWFDQYPQGEMLSDHVRAGGAKFFIDPTDPDTMLLSEPHSDRPGFYGEVAITQEDLTALVGQLTDAGRQVVIHTGGDGAHDLVLNAYEAALDGGPNLLRHRIEHVAVVRDDQIERMARLGVLASIQTSWYTADWIGHRLWGSFEQDLGPDRIGWAGRWRDLLDGGVTVIGGTDTPWTPAVSIGGWAEAVTRRGLGGGEPAPWMLAQRITIEEALYLTTAAAAYGGFEEDVKGTLEPGKLADVIVLSANPLQIPSDDLFDLEVLATLVGGETVYCADSRFCP